MYLFERLLWVSKTASEELRAKMDAGDSEKRPGELDDAALVGSPWGVHDKIDAAPMDASSVYVFNDTCIEVRGAFQEEKRGLVTFAFLAIFVFLNGLMLYDLIRVDAVMLITGEMPSGGDPLPVEGYLAGAFGFLLWGGANFFAFKYGWRGIRLELFTQRHIIARFNRKTRQVHLHRPRYAGGVVTLPWDATVPIIEPDGSEVSGIGGFLVVGWPFEKSGAGYDELAFLGRPMQGNSEILGLWEFIRRYMEEGPEAVPKPKRLLSKFPWPWESLMASLRFVQPMLRTKTKDVVIGLTIPLAPLVLLHALCHWISLLLCWAPRWPKDIREAGQPGKPAPELTTADDFGPEIAANLRRNAQLDREEVGLKATPT